MILLRVDRMVASHTIHFSSARQTIYPGTSYPAYSFGAGWIIYPGTSYLAHSFSSGWIIYLGTNYPVHSFGARQNAHLDASHLAAHFSDSRWEQVCCLIYGLLPYHTSSKVVALAIKLPSVIFQATELTKASFISPIYW